MVSDNACLSLSTSVRFKNGFPTIQTIKSSQTVSEASPFSSHPIGQSLAQFSLPKEIEEIILTAWKPKTAVKYNVRTYEDKFLILPNSSLKHTKPSRPLQSIVSHRFNGNPKLCVPYFLE